LSDDSKPVDIQCPKAEPADHSAEQAGEETDITPVQEVESPDSTPSPSPELDGSLADRATAETDLIPAQQVGSSDSSSTIGISSADPSSSASGGETGSSDTDVINGIARRLAVRLAGAVRQHPDWWVLGLLTIMGSLWLSSLAARVDRALTSASDTMSRANDTINRSLDLIPSRTTAQGSSPTTNPPKDLGASGTGFPSPDATPNTKEAEAVKSALETFSSTTFGPFKEDLLMRVNTAIDPVVNYQAETLNKTLEQLTGRIESLQAALRQKVTPQDLAVVIYHTLDLDARSLMKPLSEAFQSWASNRELVPFARVALYRAEEDRTKELISMNDARIDLKALNLPVPNPHSLEKPHDLDSGKLFPQDFNLGKGEALRRRCLLIVSGKAAAPEPRSRNWEGVQVDVLRVAPPPDPTPQHEMVKVAHEAAPAPAPEATKAQVQAPPAGGTNTPAQPSAAPAQPKPAVTKPAEQPAEANPNQLAPALPIDDRAAREELNHRLAWDRFARAHGGVVVHLEGVPKNEDKAALTVVREQIERLMAPVKVQQRETKP
jgi:hypothetical protein